MSERIRIAVALLVRQGRVLLAHRHPSRAAYPDSWSLVGGHVEPGESPHEALVRECAEEIGVEVLAAHAVPLTIEAPRLHLTAFLVTRWTGEPVNLQPQEHDDLRWFDAEELPGLRMAHPESVPDLVEHVRAAQRDSASPSSKRC